jgi:hypothetical protein
VILRVFGSDAGPIPRAEITTLSATYDQMAPVVLDSFTGGSAPSLRVLCLANISFLGLLKPLSPASTSPRIDIVDVLPSGYFSSDEMATALSVLTNPKYLMSNSSFVDSTLTRNRRPSTLRPPCSHHLVYLPRGQSRPGRSCGQNRFISHAPTLKARREVHMFLDHLGVGARLDAMNKVGRCRTRRARQRKR